MKKVKILIVALLLIIGLNYTNINVNAQELLEEGNSIEQPVTGDVTELEKEEEKQDLLGLISVPSLENDESNGENIISDELETGEVTGEKEAEIVTDKEQTEEDGDSREAEVTITIDGKEFSETTYDQIDIALVIDYSSSMVNNNTTITIEKVDGVCPTGTTQSYDNAAKCIKTITRLESAKIAAKELAAIFLNSTGNFRISLSIFDSDGNVEEVLTTNLDTINNAINSISIDGHGTNIQDGINKGVSTLTNVDNKKIVILLSDGEPYNSTYTSYEEPGNGKDKKKTYYYSNGQVSYSWTGGNSDAAKSAADYFRSIITFYTIGYNAGSTANSLLRYIAGDDSRFISATSGDALLAAFLQTAQNIQNQYTIANDAILEDIIPDTFELVETEEELNEKYKDAVTVEKIDGVTKITYDIDKITNQEITFTFHVVAKNAYHGSMFTNTSAKLTFIPVIGNPYEYNLDKNFIANNDGSYTLILTKPAVVVPAVTVNDDAGTVKTTETLEISTDYIISNDSESNFVNGTSVDRAKSVVDSIIIINAPTNGTLVINDDNDGYIYTPTGYNAGADNFTYRIKTVVTYDDGSTKTVYSNVATVNITILQKEANYVVHHYIEDTATKVAEDVGAVEGVVYYVGDEVTGYAILDLTNYQLVGLNTSKNITLSVSGNEIIFYYKLKQGAKVTVHHYIEGTTTKLADDEEKNGKATENYTTSAKIFDNYELVVIPNNAAGTFTLETQEVTYFYKLKQGAKVTVHHYEEGTTNELAISEILTGRVTDNYTSIEKDIINWELVEIPGNATGTFTLEEQTVIYYYKKVMGKVTINYVDTNGKPLTLPVIKEQQVGESYQTDKLSFEGYGFVRVDGNVTGEFAEEEIVITYVYELNDPIPNTGIVNNYIEEIMFVLAVLTLLGYVILRKRVIL